ncbi:alpha/beta hydrolase [Agriterribacter sp.]|uniref:alpha/beta hydrolase n=1 Tax=Agriterribacter sp. TaxID=2821509 RepID=UPI002CA11EE0|nr:alpha/beta hydrolase [Agriterribacter sp.]HRP57213.1 alpha/beta hydrolase [Agriterribacter sp.]
MEAKKLLFIQGGGNNGYGADEALVASLKQHLGKGYQINYPKIQSDETALDFGWTKQIGLHIDSIGRDLILVGHSFGASMILKYLSEHPVNKTIEGIFLLATPFWSGNEEWQKGLQLRDHFADSLPDEAPLFLYHCRDDEEVPFSHLDQYRRKLNKATFRDIPGGGHQFNNDLFYIAGDIKTL